MIKEAVDIKIKNCTPYGLNDSIEDNDQSKSSKEYEYLIGQAFRRLTCIGS